MQHDVRFEAGHSGEFLVAHGTGRVLSIVGTSVQRQVEFNIECLGALVTAMWLLGENNQEASEIQFFHSKQHSNINKYHDLQSFQETSKSINPTPTIKFLRECLRSGNDHTHPGRRALVGVLHLGVPGYGISDDKMKGLHTGTIFPPFPTNSTAVNRITSSKIRIIRILLDFNRVAYLSLKCSPKGRYSATYLQKEKVTTGINFPLKYQGSNKD